MNIYLYLIVGIILFEYCLSNIIRKLNLNALDSKLPNEFSDVFDKEKYKESQLYTKTKEHYSYFTSTFMMILSLSVILLGVYDIIDQYIRAFEFESNIINGLLFYGLLIILSDLISTPFSLYNIFVIEEKFGFNKTTYKTFITDKLTNTNTINVVKAVMKGLESLRDPSTVARQRGITIKELFK